ncbi:LysR family transcriptional regulator [Nonomuraea sp. NPDC049695]|uniref:LysR family transcriptional regulator n=1 Tax=Nonomuraea sp. NPDC049695 TaxID=3154734 RepID=UPI00342F5BBB
MELRDIEIFLTLADELHFGRTAERLRLTPARVTQAVKKQERQIGALLFERSSRRVRLTPVGEQLRKDLWPLYAGLKESMQRAKMAAQGKTARLRIGLIPANVHDLRPYWAAFRTHHPYCELQLGYIPYVDPFRALRRGEIDILVTWLPVEEPDLTVGPLLFQDRRLLAVAADHELAGRSSISVEAVAHFQHSGHPTSLPDYWVDSFVPFHTPGGHLLERGPSATNNDEVFLLVSTGQIVNLMAAHMPRYFSRPDIAWVPVTDMPPLTFAPVWRPETENDLIRAFARVVTDLGPLPPHL